MYVIACLVELGFSIIPGILAELTAQYIMLNLGKNLRKGKRYAKFTNSVYSRNFLPRVLASKSTVYSHIMDYCGIPARHVICRTFRILLCKFLRVRYIYISTPRDAEQLQGGLNHICAWSEKWQMKLNADKCVLLRCTRSLTPIQYTYTLNGRALISKSQHPYLGIVFDGTMSWSTHIQMVGNIEQ